MPHPNRALAVRRNISGAPSPSLTIPHHTTSSCLPVRPYQNLNVEVVLHVKRLFEQRKHLHLLHEARRNLHADAATIHVGGLTLEVISRARRGIVHTIRSFHPTDAVDADVREALCGMLRQKGCSLLHLDLGCSSGFEGTLLGEGMLLRGTDLELAPTRLRVLKLSRMGLLGEVPTNLCKCVWLHTLELQDNGLIGHIPTEIAKLRRLETLALHGNALSGDVPAESLAQLTQLGTLTLGGDLGGNEKLAIGRSGAAILQFALPEADLHLCSVISDEPASPNAPASVGVGVALSPLGINRPYERAMAAAERGRDAGGAGAAVSEAPTGGRFAAEDELEA